MGQDPPSAPPALPPPLTSWILPTAPGTLLAMCYVHTQLTGCTLNGDWIEQVGTVVSTSSTQPDGSGVYFCSVQTNTHLKMVQFEVSLSAGSTYARPGGRLPERHLLRRRRQREPLRRCGVGVHRNLLLRLLLWHRLSHVPRMVPPLPAAAAGTAVLDWP